MVSAFQHQRTFGTRLSERQLSSNCGHSSGCYDGDMTRAWFPRWMGVGYVPIPWQGRCVLAAMLIIFLPFAALFVLLPNGSLVSWACAAVAAGSALIGQAKTVRNKSAPTFANAA